MNRVSTQTSSRWSNSLSWTHSFFVVLYVLVWQLQAIYLQASDSESEWARFPRTCCSFFDYMMRRFFGSTVAAGPCGFLQNTNTPIGASEHFVGDETTPSAFKCTRCGFVTLEPPQFSKEFVGLIDQAYKFFGKLRKCYK